MNLSGPVWRLKEWESGGKTEAVPKGIEITASIRDGRISGRSACNSYFGSCEWSSNGTLRISRVAATQMACEADVMRWESRYTSALEKLDGWSISDSVLTLDAEGKEQLRFRSAPSKR
jgi:heat shock protein HslJ